MQGFIEIKGSRFREIDMKPRLKSCFCQQSPVWLWANCLTSMCQFPHLSNEIKASTYLKMLKNLRQWHPTPVLLPGKFHGWRSLVGYSPWGRKELDTIERLHFHFALSCIGEENGNPLQCSCLENPRDGGWTSWAAISGVAQSRTRLKRFSSSTPAVYWNAF